MTNENNLVMMLSRSESVKNNITLLNAPTLLWYRCLPVTGENQIEKSPSKA